MRIQGSSSDNDTGTSDGDRQSVVSGESQDSLQKIRKARRKRISEESEVLYLRKNPLKEALHH